MPNPVKWGVLGYAGIARKEVIPAIIEAENAVPYAIASRDVSKLDTAVQTFGFVKTYQDYQALLSDPDVEAVYIPLPNALHKEWTLKALRAGKHVLCEKPLAQTEDDCREMLDAAKQAGVLLGEAFMYRFANRAAVLKKLLDAGTIGKVTSVYASHRFVLKDAKNVRVNAQLGGGSIWDIGCYPVNIIGMIMDDEPVSICAQKIDFQNVDFALSAVLKYPNDAICTLSCGFNGQCALLTEINGTQGSVILTDAFGDSDAPLQLIQNEQITLIPVPACHRYTMEIEAFSRSIRTGEPLPYDAHEALRNTRVINRILEAAK